MLQTTLISHIYQRVVYFGNTFLVWIDIIWNISTIIIRAEPLYDRNTFTPFSISVLGTPWDSLSRDSCPKNVTAGENQYLPPSHAQHQLSDQRFLSEKIKISFWELYFAEVDLILYGIIIISSYKAISRKLSNEMHQYLSWAEVKCQKCLSFRKVAQPSHFKSIVFWILISPPPYHRCNWLPAWNAEDKAQISCCVCFQHSVILSPTLTNF